MLKHITHLLTFLVLVFLSNFTHAEVNTYNLKQHISSKCSKHCATELEVLDAIVNAETLTGVGFTVLLAIMTIESSFNKQARNKHSVGLMQINLTYHKNKFSNKDYLNPRANVLAGARIFKQCLFDSRNNFRLAARCYNGSRNDTYYRKIAKAKTLVDSIDFTH